MNKAMITGKQVLLTGGGSGIGLSIVRAIMHAHNGGCGVRNVEQGVAFYLTLPKHP